MADTTIFSLTATTTLADSDVAVVVDVSDTAQSAQGSTRKVTLLNLKTFMSASPTLVTPALGTPSSGTLTNCTGLPVATGISGLGTGAATFLATPSSANLRAMLTDEAGTGVAYFVGGALGTPASGTLTSCTGLPVSTGISGLGTGVATFLATPSSANLAAMVTDETGTGSLVLATSPTLVTPNIGVATATSINGTSIPSSSTLATANATATLSANTNLTRASHGNRLIIADTGGVTLTVEDDTTGVWGSGDTAYGVFTASSGTLTLAGDGTSTVTAGYGMSLVGYPGQEFMLYRTGTNAWRGGFPDPTLQQRSVSAAYTTVMADRNTQIYHPSADTTARVWTIDSNANVPYPIGTTLTFVNDTSAGALTIAITSDTLVLAGAGTTGSRTLAASGIATAVKMTSTRWMINGTGLT